MHICKVATCILEVGIDSGTSMVHLGQGTLNYLPLCLGDGVLGIGVVEGVGVVDCMLIDQLVVRDDTDDCSPDPVENIVLPHDADEQTSR